MGSSLFAELSSLPESAEGDDLCERSSGLAFIIPPDLGSWLLYPIVEHPTETTEIFHD